MAKTSLSVEDLKGKTNINVEDLQSFFDLDKVRAPFKFGIHLTELDESVILF